MPLSGGGDRGVTTGLNANRMPERNMLYKNWDERIFISHRRFRTNFFVLFEFEKQKNFSLFFVFCNRSEEESSNDCGYYQRRTDDVN